MSRSARGRRRERCFVVCLAGWSHTDRASLLVRADLGTVLPPARPRVASAHPLGRYRARVPDRVVFAQVVAALGHGSEYEWIATLGCSDRTIRWQLKEWANADGAATRHPLALEQYDWLSPLDFKQPPWGSSNAAHSILKASNHLLERKQLIRTDRRSMAEYEKSLDEAQHHLIHARSVMTGCHSDH